MQDSRLPAQYHADFERIVLPHLDAAYNLARWLTQNDEDAEDLVQEACLRAFRFLDRYHDGNSRAWLLTIVRHLGYTWLQQKRRHEPPLSLDGEGRELPSSASQPEAITLRKLEAESLRQVLGELPAEFRQVIVMHDVEGLSYKEIAAISQVPIGTVMSRLARARKRVQHRLSGEMAGTTSENVG
jgi:RNA polymerase sigma-70 factor (ECF subfamily)